jgi:hypothetical protein
MSGSSAPHHRQRVSASERARRNAQMAARKAAGATWTQIARDFSVAVSTARQGVADHAAVGPDSRVVLPAGDPLAVSAEDALRDALRTYSWASGQLRRLVGDADNTSAAVGAIRTAVAVEEARLNALVAAGVIPTVETALVMRMQDQLREEKRRFAVAVMDLLQRRGLDTELVLRELGVDPGPEALAA